VGPAARCCGGTACCGDGSCQVQHQTGLGPTFLDCFPAGYSAESALRAARAWRPGGFAGNGVICAGDCVTWSDGSACASFCWSGAIQGRVFLETIQPVCTCNAAAPGSWN
jgi:hypothetical protein